MKVLAEYGSFKVVKQHRQKFGESAGLDPVWTEYQVRHGRRVVARHELLSRAVIDAQELNHRLWDEIGEQLRKGTEI